MKTRTLALLVASILAVSSHAALAENLLQVYQRAKGYDAQLKSQESSYLATLEKKQQALAGLKPQVGLSGTAAYDTSRNTISGSTVDGSVGSYKLELGKSLINKGLNATVGKTDALVAQATAALESYRQDLITRVSDAYFNTLTAQDNLEFARAEKAAIGRQLEQTRAYFEAGRSAITDVKEAESSYAAAVAQEITAIQQLDVAREQLRVLTGGFYQSLNAPRTNMPLNMPNPNSIEAWVNTAKQNNYLLRASKQAIAVQEKEVEVQRAAKSPNLGLFANHTGSYANNDTYNDLKTYDTAVGVNLTVPLYTGGAISSRIREAQHTLRQTQQQYDLQERQTEQLARSAFLTVQSSISQVKANQQALASAETAAEATQAGFEVGTRTAVDVLNSLRNVFRARRDYASARYSYLRNMLALRQAAGTLSEKEVAAISALMTVQPKAATTSSTQDQSAETPEPTEQLAAPTEAAPATSNQGGNQYYVMPENLGR
ncbi:MAG: TolC family outer membrane protein [Gammaproteobacteria bacterium]|nr:TolC family outer membrane protein [Gammaproteobacteria bacterium]MBU1723991.1 TolC family outer membrane protein [Gammaproteobacteria bacterium]MBU2005542.1 TolC family outer membrane protein [Gammaproteobacteria bacterium]